MPVPAGAGVADPDLLASVADLQSLLGDTIDIARATMLLETATAAVQAAAGGQRILQVVDDTVTLDLDEHDGGLHLYLPQRPVTAVATVKVGTTTVTDVSAQLSRGRLWRPCGWLASTVTVTYTHGFPAGDQRLQLARAATLQLAAAAYASPAGVVREQLDDHSVAYAETSGQLTVEVAAAIRRQYAVPARSLRLVLS